MSTVIELSNPSNNNATVNGPAPSQPEFPSNAVLQRMKEMEHQLQEMKNTITNLEIDNNTKESLIKKLESDKEELSTERRKDMEQILESAVNDWLNSLKGISEEVRTQFKSGITNIAKKADIKNHAWEVICNASHTHKENVAEIDRLVKLCNEKEKTIESLLEKGNDPQFRSTVSRVAIPEVIPSGSKRSSSETEPIQRDTVERDAKVQKNGDAWDSFANMIFESSRNQYY